MSTIICNNQAVVKQYQAWKNLNLGCYAFNRDKED